MQKSARASTKEQIDAFPGHQISPNEKRVLVQYVSGYNRSHCIVIIHHQLWQCRGAHVVGSGLRMFTESSKMDRGTISNERGLTLPQALF